MNTKKQMTFYYEITTPSPSPSLRRRRRRQRRRRLLIQLPVMLLLAMMMMMMMMMMTPHYHAVFVVVDAFIYSSTIKIQTMTTTTTMTTTRRRRRRSFHNNLRRNYYYNGPIIISKLLLSSYNNNNNNNINISIDPLVTRIFDEEQERQKQLQGGRRSSDNDDGEINELDEDDYDSDSDSYSDHNEQQQQQQQDQPLLLMESLRQIQCGIIESSRGIQVWKRILIKGRAPIESDFNFESNHYYQQQQQPQGSSNVWPPQPLFDCLVNSITSPSLQLPRLAVRHPEMIPILLRSILRQVIEYAKQNKQITSHNSSHQSRDNDDDEEEEEEDDDEEYDYYSSYDDDEDVDYEDKNEEKIDKNDNESTTTMMNEMIIAQEIADNFTTEWADAVQGINHIDDIFGYDHDLLVDNDEDEDNSEDEENSNTLGGSSSLGFGISDGIWEHTGWKLLPVLQKQISNIPELKELMKTIGRRPTAEDQQHDGKYEKFVPREAHPDGGLGAEFDPYIKKESVTGITFSNNLSEMLPSEAILLRERRRRRSSSSSTGNIDDDNGNDDESSSSLSSSVLRRLFLAKMAESKLLSYELSGWTDIPSIPKPNSLYKNRLPSGPGGPIIVCLDTSWSMSTGRRENLSKAVVLSCVIEANKQKRNCQIVSFSTSKQVIESGVITPDTAGIKRLLEFLSYSFGGGTDVTGALKFAISTLLLEEENEDSNNNNNNMDAADILLITDGEIPDPPVPNHIMESIDRLIKLKGVEVHGLLIGKSESIPLSKLCTHTHNFLSQYDNYGMIPPTTRGSSRTPQ